MIMRTGIIKNISRRLTFVTVFLLLLTSGCQNGFLDENPLDSISEGIFWNSSEDCYQALMGVYSTYAERTAERINNLDKSMIWMSSFAGYSSWRTFDWTRGIEIQATHGTITTMWRKLYVQISRANYFLDNIGKADMPAEEKAQMTAEVRFLRAFSYFWLSQMYGNVAMPTHTLTFDEANNIGQTNEKEVREFILSELSAIAGDLALSHSATEKGRIEKGAALALKGRVLLAEKRWADAADTYREIMNLGRYEIDPRFKQLFITEGENNQEFIFVNKYMENEFGESMSQHTIRSSLYGGFNACNLFQHFLDEFPMKDGESISESGLYNPQKPFENRDPRLYETVLITGYSEVNGEVFQGDPVTIARTGQTGANITGYILQKFWDRSFTGNRQYYGADYPQIRYAEILLSRLEAELEAGTPVTQGLLDETINRIRKRPAVNMPEVTEKDPSKLREIVRRERVVELSFEGGIEYFDMRRWGTLREMVDREYYGMKMTDDPANYEGIHNINQEGHLVIGRQRFYDFNYLWPIPLSELDVNSNLNQNPGYN